MFNLKFLGEMTRIQDNPLFPLFNSEEDDIPKVPCALTIDKKRRNSVLLQGLPEVHRRWNCDECGMQVGNIYPINDESSTVFDILDLNFKCWNCQSRRDEPIACSKCDYIYGNGNLSMDLQIYYICYSCINEATLIYPHEANQSLSEITDLVFRKTKKPKKGRTYLQKCCYCCTCGKTDIFVNYYSARDDRLEPNQINCLWMCSDCDKDSESNDFPLTCSICKRKQGSGSIQYNDNSKKVDNIVDLFPKCKKRSDNDIITQIVCHDCDKKWQICSECGGGGRLRTGKYRPVELFSAGRRTCKLSHIRLGSNITDFECWSCEEPQKFINLLHELQSVHEDSYLSMNALSELMENPEWPFKTFESIKTHTINNFNTLMKQMIIPVTHKRKYISVAFGPKDDKKVTRASNNSSLILFNSLIKEKFYNSRRIIVAYACLEWDISTPILNLTDIVLRAINSNSTLFSTLVSVLVKQALKDESLEKINIPNCYLVTKIRQEYTRILILAEKMGFTIQKEQDGYNYLTIPLLELLKLKN